MIIIDYYINILLLIGMNVRYTVNVPDQSGTFTANLGPCLDEVVTPTWIEIFYGENLIKLSRKSSR